jgi:hypothetical protein
VSVERALAAWSVRWWRRRAEKVTVEAHSVQWMHVRRRRPTLVCTCCRSNAGKRNYPRARSRLLTLNARFGYELSPTVPLRRWGWFDRAKRRTTTARKVRHGVAGRDRSDRAASRGHHRRRARWIRRISSCAAQKATRTRVLRARLFLWPDHSHRTAPKTPPCC